MPAHEVKTISVKQDNDMRDRIRIIADAKKRTTHWVMRQAIEQYIEREEKRETFRQETWGEIDEKAAPACHR